MLHLRILTTDRTVFNDVADQVNLVTESGITGVLGHHTPLVSVIKPGEVVVKKDDAIHTFTVIGGGVLEVRPGSQVIMLVQAVETASV